MLFDIIGEFFLICFGILIINAGIWINQKMNNFEYEKDTQIRILIVTCIVGIIYFIFFIIRSVKAGM
jgi:uncharacterized membrane protein YidH (DUF202 family)